VLQTLAAVQRLGWRCTRLDIALDFHEGHGAHLIETMYEACVRGELTGAKRFQIIRDMGQEGPTGHGLNIGGRGKMGSGRYLRTYDKGLEQGDQPMGEWVRMEVEYTGECAHQAGILLAETTDPDTTMSGLVLGTVDFREYTGRKNQNLDERPRVQWWEDLVRSCELARPVAIRSRTTVAGYIRWIRTAVAPKVATLAACTGLGVSTLMVMLAGQMDHDTRHLNDPVVRGLLTDLGVSTHHARAALDDIEMFCLASGVPT
jgi:hypothetical protein